MSYESGVYPTIDTTGLIPMAGVRSGVIGLIGHVKLKSGSSYTAFSTNTVGSVIDLNGNNYQKWINENADFSTDGWVEGDESEDKGSYDKYNAGIRALELIFLANGNAQVKFLPLEPDDSNAPTAESSTDKGLNEALTELLKYTEVSWVHVAGKVPLSAVQSHVATASGNDYGAERIYVAGLDFMHLYDDTMTLTVPSNYTSLQNDNGRTVVFATRSAVNFVFDTPDGTTEANPTRLVGGNLLSAYYLGLLSGLNPYEPILRKTYPFKQVDVNVTESNYTRNTNEFILPLADRQTLLGDYINYVRQDRGINFFEIGRTFCGSGSAYERITTRRIMDYVVKSVRNNLTSYLAKKIDNPMLIAANSKLYNVLRDLKNRGYISPDYEASVFATAQDVIDGKIEANVTVSPTNYIGYISVNISTV